MQSLAFDGRAILPGTDLRLSSIGIGCARIGGVFSQEAAGEHGRLISTACDLGINVFDTADIYTQGESERTLGKALGRRRQDAIVISKAGYVLTGRSPLVDRAKPILRPLVQKLGLRRGALPASVRGGVAGQNFGSDYLVAAVEGSLRRLGTDYLDVLLLHSPPASVLAEGGFLEAARRLRRDGKIRWFGVSCERPSDAPLAIQWEEVACIEVPLNLLEQEATELAIAPAIASGKGVVGRQCFASGLLAGGQVTHLHGDDMSTRKAEIEALSRSATRMGSSLPELALAFSLATPGVSSTLVGAHATKHLVDLQAWASRPGLTESEYAALRRTGPAD